MASDAKTSALFLSAADCRWLSDLLTDISTGGNPPPEELERAARLHEVLGKMADLGGAVSSAAALAGPRGSNLLGVLGGALVGYALAQPAPRSTLAHPHPKLDPNGFLDWAEEQYNNRADGQKAFGFCYLCQRSTTGVMRTIGITPMPDLTFVHDGEPRYCTVRRIP